MHGRMPMPRRYQMAEYGHGSRRLPPARLSPIEFHEIDSILGDEYKNEDASLSWDFYRRDRSNSSENLEEVLREVEDKKGIHYFEVVAEDAQTRITISAGDDGCQIDYEAPEAHLGKVLGKVRAIEAIFREHRRWTAHLPNWPAALRRPALNVGQPAFTIRLSRDEIIQGVLTRWLAMVFGLPVAFGFGVFTGWLAF
jgi:hypothetical protein